MIVDSLTHVTPDGGWFGTGLDAGLDRLIREMDQAGVDRAVVVALAGHIENSFVAQACASRAPRLIPGASLDPGAFSSARQAARALRELFDQGGFRVLKLHPRLNAFDPLDKPCLALLEEAAALASPPPIWLDTIMRSNRCLFRKAPVETVQELAVRFPGLRLVLLHGGGSLLLPMADMVRDYPNLYLYLSLTLLYYQPSSLRQDLLFALGRRDRQTMVGSDFPEFTPARYLAEVRGLAREAGLGPDRLERILGGNLRDLLNLA